METKLKLTPATFLCEMTKLKAQQKYLEATQSSLDAFNKLPEKDASFYVDAQLLKTELDNKFNYFKDTLKLVVNDCLSVVNSFSETMLTENGIQNYNTNEYRDQIIIVDKKFRNIAASNTNQLKKLKDEYREFDSSSLPCAMLLHNFEKECPKVFSRPNRKRNKIMCDASDNLDVKKFLDFLTATNGHTGGWIDEEHNLYVKLKNKYKSNMEQIIMSIRHILPGIYIKKLGLPFHLIFFRYVG